MFVASEQGDSSYLLYLQDRTLLARRADRRSLAMTGDPVPVASDVALFPVGFHASFWSSASGNLLAYRTEASDKPRLTSGLSGWQAAERDRHRRLLHAPARVAGWDAGGDGTCDGSGNMDIWTWDFARRIKTRQTFDPKPDRSPTWSPNGREIAFSSLRTGIWQLFRKDVSSGQPEEQLTTGAGDKIVPDWSRDGRSLVFIQIGTTTAEDIWALPLDGDRQPYPILQTPAIETNPALSPDGHWLAYESSQSGRPEVLVTRFPVSRTRSGRHGSTVAGVHPGREPAALERRRAGAVLCVARRSEHHPRRRSAIGRGLRKRRAARDRRDSRDAGCAIAV